MWRYPTLDVRIFRLQTRALCYNEKLICLELVVARQVFFRLLLDGAGAARMGNGVLGSLEPIWVEGIVDIIDIKVEKGSH
jgi:hypothetical protein